jgi:hypothetical protein
MGSLVVSSPLVDVVSSAVDAAAAPPDDSSSGSSVVVMMPPIDVDMTGSLSPEEPLSPVSSTFVLESMPARGDRQPTTRSAAATGERRMHMEEEGSFDMRRGVGNPLSRVIATPACGATAM